MRLVANFPIAIWTWLPIFLLQFGCLFPYDNLDTVSHKIDDGEKVIATSPLLNNYLSSHYSPFQIQIAGYSPPIIKTTHGYHLSEIYRSWVAT
jgi:hypothetical protein